MKNANNQQRKSQFREMLDTIASIAVVLGSIFAYIGFVFDFTIMQACGSLVALTATCTFMTPDKSRKNDAK